jgi:hypothetical protein
MFTRFLAADLYLQVLLVASGVALLGLAKSRGAGMVTLGAAIAGLYALADGIGVALFRIQPLGVVALLWAMVVGLGWWIAGIFW